MRVFASSLHSWKAIEEQEDIKVPHNLTFPLAVVKAIGEPHGLAMAPEEETPDGPHGFDAIFISVMDSRILTHVGEHFLTWGIPFFSAERNDRHPLVICGGQGLHNPLPLARVADAILIGDGEDAIPQMVAAYHRAASRWSFLADVASIVGWFVPSVHDRRRDVITQAVTSDVGVTLRHDIRINNNGQRRVEIARGCKYKCAFCSLGWRTPMRENGADEIIDVIKKSPRLVHLQAGDAESHSGISLIRRALEANGGRDSGWTGRLDSLLSNPDATIEGGKRYAFGVEGASFRLRRAVGKGYLTDDRLVNDTVKFLTRVAEDSAGRAAWHLIAGLPSERPGDILELIRVVQRINHELRFSRQRSRNLSLHWQPFQPLPGTPMQWCGAGSGARDHARMMKTVESMPMLRVRQLTGRTDEMARVCTIVSRADERGADLLWQLGKRRVGSVEAAEIAGVGFGPLDPDSDLPWDFVQQWTPKDRLRRAYDVMQRRLVDDRIQAVEPEDPGEPQTNLQIQ